MQPAICSACGLSAALEKDGEEGDWLRFAEYQEANESALTHPDGLHYFCFEHMGPASKLVHMSSMDAFTELKITYKPYSPEYTRPENKPWWKRLLSGL